MREALARWLVSTYPLAVLRLPAGPGRIDVGIGWGIGYGVGYVALCRVLKARRGRRDAVA